MSEPDPQMPRINETFQSLMIYSSIIQAEGPLTVRELMRATGLPDGTVYPILDKRVSAGLMTEDEETRRPTTYGFTLEGYERAKYHLLKLEVGLAAWLRTEQRFG